jgi:opacity protein-like surface antigen
MKRIVPIALLFFIMSLSALAVTGIRIGAHIGAVKGFDYEFQYFAQGSNPPWVSLWPHADMPMIGWQIDVGTLQILDFSGFVDYAWKERQPISGVKIRMSDLSFGVTAKKKIDFPIVKPYFGAGIGWHALVYSLKIQAGGQNLDVVIPENTTRVGYHIVGGVEADLPAFPLVPYIEYRLHWVNTPNKFNKFAVLMAGLSLAL